MAEMFEALVDKYGPEPPKPLQVKSPEAKAFHRRAVRFYTEPVAVPRNT